MRTFTLFTTLVGLVASLVVAGGHAQQLIGPAPPPPYKIPRATSPVPVDGVLDERTWRDALKVDLNVEVQPGENVPAPVRTVALITYDSRFLSVAFRASDPDPSDTRAATETIGMTPKDRTVFVEFGYAWLM